MLPIMHLGHWVTSLQQFIWLLQRSLSICQITYSERSNSFRPLGAHPPLAHLPLDPTNEVPEWFGAGDDVERSRQSGPFFKVTHPQLCPGKLPLDVCVILQPRLGRMKRTAQHKHRPLHTCHVYSMFDLCSQQCAGTSCSSWLWACWGAPPVRWCCRCRTWWRRQTRWTDGLHPHWSHTGWSDRRLTRRETVGSQITCSRKKNILSIEGFCLRKIQL